VISVGNRRAKKPRRPKQRKAKLGIGYEQVVAEIIQAVDPRATAQHGEWVMGPDGRRDLDVQVTGCINGIQRKILIECKDYNRRTTGPVGIAIVDALESKRRDVGVDQAFLCSNAGFTRDAARKANRVGIGLIGVMRHGDARVRFSIMEDVYIRHLEIKRMTISLFNDGTLLRLEGALPDCILYKGIPLGNWIQQRISIILAANPVVNARFRAPHRLTEKVDFEGPNGIIMTADRFDFEVDVSGCWYVQTTEIDATAALFNWFRHRIHLTPIGGKFTFKHLDLHGGEPILRPPEHVHLRDVHPGETWILFLIVKGLGENLIVPPIEQHIEASCLDPLAPEWPDEAFVSTMP
jgi:hypothetical protein